MVTFREDLGPRDRFTQRRKGSKDAKKKSRYVLCVFAPFASLREIPVWYTVLLMLKYKTIALLGLLFLVSLPASLFAQQSKQPFLYPIVKDEKWGFIDQTGRVVVSPQFDSVDEFQDGLARVIDKGRVAFIDTSGKVVLRPEFEIVRDFSEGLAAVNNGQKRTSIGLIVEPGRWGYIDKTGQLAIPMNFTHAEPFSEGLAAAGLDKRTGFIDRKGKMIFEVPLDATLEFSEGIVGVLLSGRISYFDSAGKKLITPPLDPSPSSHSFSEGLATIETGGKSGYIDKAGKLVIAAEFVDADDFSEGLAPAQVMSEMRWCATDENGSRYGSPKSFGYIDKTGKMVIAPQFEYAAPFREGLARVSTCRKAGFIDKTGKVVIPLQFEEAFSFRGGLARVSNRGSEAFAYIDKTGKVIWPRSQ
jgi:WG containing repeat